MAKSNPDGTTVTVDPVPDSVSKPDDQAYDYDFQNLGTPNSNDAPPADGGDVTPAPKSDGDKPPVGDTLLTDTTPSVTVDPDKLVADNEIQSYKDQITSLTSQVKKLENVQNALKELEREPLVFMKKYIPNIAEKISPESYIKSKLQNEFSPNFKYDPSEAYDEGTSSYKWRLREAEIRDQLMRENARLEAEQGVTLREREASLKVQKEKVMKAYGLDENRFKTEIQDWSTTKVVTLEDIAKIRYFDQIIKTAVDKALKSNGRVAAGTPPVIKGAADAPGGDQTDSSKQYAEFVNEFGD